MLRSVVNECALGVGGDQNVAKRLSSLGREGRFVTAAALIVSCGGSATPLPAAVDSGSEASGASKSAAGDAGGQRSDANRDAGTRTDGTTAKDAASDVTRMATDSGADVAAVFEAGTEGGDAGQILVCAASQTVCGEGAQRRCSDLQTDPNDCGGCGAVCPAGTYCSEGTCGPSCVGIDSTLCSGTCVDIQTDNAHCGTCGTACPAGQVCSGGSCAAACGTPFVSCGAGASATCALPSIDPENCGACGNACAKGEVCSSGSCGAACSGPTATECNGLCVDAETDHDNCGACGVVCAAGLACSAGHCAPTCSPSCGPGNVCAKASDCASGVCANGTCAPPACSPSCPDNNACGANTDCASGSCADSVCAPPGCSPSCADGQTCGANGDCLSGSCSGDDPPTCCPATYTGCGGVCVYLPTDTNNCGSCGAVCAGECAAGRCIETLYTGSVNAFAIDATNAYITSSTDVVQVPLTGGTPLTLVAGSDTTIAIAVDASSVYWNDQHGFYKVPIGGGDVVTLVDATTASVYIASASSMTVSNGNLYFPAPNGPGSDVYKVPAGGGALTTFATGQDEPQAIAFDAADIYWTDTGGDLGQGSVVKASPAGGAPVTLATGLTFNSRAPTLTINVTSAFWADAEDNLVLSVPLVGGLVTTLASNQDTPTSVVADSANIYWSNLGDPGLSNGAILTAPLAGGAPTTLASTQVDPGEVLIDPTFVYWSSLAGRGLFRTTK